MGRGIKWHATGNLGWFCKLVTKFALDLADEEGALDTPNAVAEVGGGARGSASSIRAAWVSK